MFTEHTIESAPPASRRAMAAVAGKQGYLPAAVALLAESPETLEGFLRMSAAFDACTLDPLAREVVIMTVAERNGCHLCLAMHTARLAALGADPALAAALRSSAPLADARLDAVRAFTAPGPRHRGGRQATSPWPSSSATASPGATRWRWSSASAPTPCPPWPTASPAPRSTRNCAHSPKADEAPNRCAARPSR